MNEIIELDLNQLDGDLYTAWKQLEKGNYGSATNLICKSWLEIRRFRLSLDDRHLPATTDRDLKALLIKALYWLRNRKPQLCRLLGYNCEWVYPYGFVPEGGCPYHD